MIQFTKSYKTVDGSVFGTLDEAQSHEIEVLLNTTPFPEPHTGMMAFAKFLVQHKNAIVDILTTTPSSKPKARAIHGGTKKRSTRDQTSILVPVTSPTPVAVTVPSSALNASKDTDYGLTAKSKA